MFGAIPVDQRFLDIDLWIMLAAALVLLPFVFLGWKITRVWGIVLTAIYITYIASLIH